ncbi:conserved hypothetical protein [Vibrio harveyi]|uniref:Uncharacterized protein n=1 Tax=Vibrio harveyi TaxID=669 RepID=A0A454CM71_VIBHA|nr:hypothetical protein VCHENC02_0518 [Vibrio harveyi]CAH1555893.1 conserved hypothetical protein [Vibrio rotiferianus]CAH1235372.1 conserved hypothetical protein [Vibrio harveyi]CAH1546882.1 conserved hypothetical protein [Vibrio harveyi]CAH1581414.1 conserved hypothetical protein [Vibrio harveyi]
MSSTLIYGMNYEPVIRELQGEIEQARAGERRVFQIFAQAYDARSRQR